MEAISSQSQLCAIFLLVRMCVYVVYNHNECYNMCLCTSMCKVHVDNICKCKRRCTCVYVRMYVCMHVCMHGRRNVFDKQYKHKNVSKKLSFC